MKELLFAAGVVMIGYWVYLKCEDKKSLKPVENNNSDQPNYTTPPQSMPLNTENEWPARIVQQFDASENATVSRPITTIKVGVNEPTHIQQIV
jgi:hypothetical protein